MNLEIKHLASYLQWELKLIQKKDWHSENWEDYDIVTLNQLSKYNDEWFYVGANKDGNTFVSYENFQFKPILRPLSDLVKEIEVNGKTFIPSIQLSAIEGILDATSFERWLFVMLSEERETLPFRIISKLFEWHFDFYGLIEAGLAIDINSINKTTL